MMNQCVDKKRGTKHPLTTVIQSGSSCILLENLILSQNKAAGFRHTKVQLS